MKLIDLKSQFKNGEVDKHTFIDYMHEYHKVLHEYSHFLSDSGIDNISIENDLVIMKLRESGLRFIVDENDKRITPLEFLNFGSFEQEEMDAIKKLLKTCYNSEFSFFDIGGNVGWFSMDIQKEFPKAKIECFEPIPKTFKYLEENMKLNCFSNIKLNNFGFSNEDKTLNFYYDISGSGATSLAETQVDMTKVEGKVKKLDDYASMKSVDFIKCDVEGAELLVFQGGINIIERDKPLIYAEMLRKYAAKFDYHPNEIITLLANIGYKCYYIESGKIIELEKMTDETKETNFIFINDEHKVEL